MQNAAHLTAVVLVGGDTLQVLLVQLDSSLWQAVCGEQHHRDQHEGHVLEILAQAVASSEDGGLDCRSRNEGKRNSPSTRSMTVNPPASILRKVMRRQCIKAHNVQLRRLVQVG
jgi:hypothetical protein